MTILIMCIDIFLAIRSLVKYFKSQALPIQYFIYLTLNLLAYMILIQVMKSFYVKRYGWQ